MKLIRYFNVHMDRMENGVSQVKVLNTTEEAKNLLNTFNHPKILNGCYMVVDKDGDFVDACSGKLPSHTLYNVIDRVMQSHPQNAPFRLIKWTGYEFVEVTPVT